MFERYTEKARRTIFYARYEASQHGSQYIEVGHLLLGLARESFPTIRILAAIDGDAWRRAVEAFCPKSPDKISVSVDLPLSHPGKRVLGYAAEEAERMRHGHIGPEHLLLGVLRENGPEAEALGGLGIALEAARDAFRESAGDPAIDRLRHSVEKLLAELSGDRLAAAATILTGLASGYVTVSGATAEGPFSFTFGKERPAAGS